MYVFTCKMSKIIMYIFLFYYYNIKMNAFLNQPMAGHPRRDFRVRKTLWAMVLSLRCTESRKYDGRLT